MAARFGWSQPQSERRRHLSLRRRHQSYALASQVHALTHVQGETLDALKEGVAAFGADGRMKLFNPAFAELWRFDPAALRDRPHIDGIARACKPLCRDPALLDELRAMIVGLPEHREGRAARVERTDGLILDCAALPLPDGATLMTSLDVTASANVERALTERNQALIARRKAAQRFRQPRLLRTAYAAHQHYRLHPVPGGWRRRPLNPKQLEYAGFITNSSHALLAIIDDILDLATIDAGALELRLEEVDVAEAMKAAAAGVQDRLSEAAIELRIVMTDGVGPCAPTSGACARFCSIFFPTRSTIRRRARPSRWRRCGAARRSCSRSATAGAASRPR